MSVCLLVCALQLQFYQSRYVCNCCCCCPFSSSLQTSCSPPTTQTFKDCRTPWSKLYPTRPLLSMPMQNVPGHTSLFETSATYTWTQLTNHLGLMLVALSELQLDDLNLLSSVWPYVVRILLLLPLKRFNTRLTENVQKCLLVLRHLGLIT